MTTLDPARREIAEVRRALRRMRARRWWSRLPLVRWWLARRARRLAPLWQALLSVECALDVLAPRPGAGTMADPVQHLEAARDLIALYLGDGRAAAPRPPRELAPGLAEVLERNDRDVAERIAALVGGR